MNERVSRSAEPRLLGTPSNEGEERRRLVLERKAQHDLEKHEKLLQKLGQVEDRRQAVMEERRRKAMESANRLNERIAQANAKRRQQEEQNRMKKESAMKKTEDSSERAAVIKRRNTIPRSFSMHVAANKQSPGTQTGGDAKSVQPTIRVAHVPRRILKAGQASAHDTSGSDSDSGRLTRSKSARFASAVALGAPKAASTPLRLDMNKKPMISGGGKATITRSKSTRVISNRRSSPDTNSTSENSSVRNSVENKVKFSTVAQQDKKSSPSGPSAVAVRRSQSNPARRVEPRKAIEAKPMSPLISQSKKPSASTSKLVPDVKAKASPKPRPETPTEAQQPVPEKKFDAAEEEFKKKLAEKRRLAREKQNKKSEKPFAFTSVVSMPNVATNDIASEKDTTDESFSMEDVMNINDVTVKNEPVAVQKPEPESISESEKEKEARKQREREEAVALRMKKIEEEREQARLKEAEENAKLENEERERERLLKEAELERQRKQEEEERAARKAKLEAIMARTRAGGGANVTRALASSVLETHKRKEEERVTDNDVTTGVSEPTSEQSRPLGLSSAGDVITSDDNNNVEPSPVEHDSPTGSKVASPGVDDLSSSVGGGHNMVSVHETESTTITTVSTTAITADSNFEQVIVLPSEERPQSNDDAVPEPISETTADPSCESDERDVILSKASDENNDSPVPNFSNPVSHDNDNAEHMQFHF